MSSSQFLVDFFKDRTTAPVCVVALPNERGKGSQKAIYTRNPADVDYFVKQHDKKDWAIYFCVSTIAEGKTRSKENVAELTGVHADLDFKAIREGRKAIEKVIKGLPLFPSWVIDSGHGLHLYFSCNLSDPARAEMLMKRLAWALAGDPAVCETARLMRLPGTHNTKNGEWKECKIVSAGSICTADEIESWLVGLKQPLLHYREREQVAAPVEKNVFELYGEEAGSSERLDIDEMLDELQYPGNVHHTEVKLIASLLARGMPVDEAINFVCAELQERISESRDWDWKTEVQSLRKDCVSWFIKKPDVFELQEDPPEWLLKHPRIKKNLQEELKPKVVGDLSTLFLEDLQQRDRVELNWIVPGFVVFGVLNGLFGDGGVGKDLLLLQLAIAMTCGGKWLGRDVKQGKVMYFPVEDDEDELRRREDRITSYLYDDDNYDPRPGSLMIVPMLGKDTVLATFDSKSGVVKPTGLYKKISELIGSFKPDLVIVGNRVNIFSVNQNEDAQARQCLQLLNALCVNHKTTVLMPSHASLGGMASGEGTSGSVQWNNGVRLRMYLSRVKGEKGEPEPDPDLRQLEVKKANWSRTGDIIEMHWVDGVFKSDTTEEKQEEIKQQSDDFIEREFLRMLIKYTNRGDHVSSSSTARNNAPTEFLHDKDCKVRSRFKLVAAMDRLFKKKAIRNVATGPQSRPRPKLEMTEQYLKLVIDDKALFS